MPTNNMITKEDKNAAVLAFIKSNRIERGLTQIRLEDLYLLFFKWLAASKYDFAPTKRQFAKVFNSKFKSAHASVTEKGLHTSRKIYYLSKSVGIGA